MLDRDAYKAHEAVFQNPRERLSPGISSFRRSAVRTSGGSWRGGSALQGGRRVTRKTEVRAADHRTAFGAPCSAGGARGPPAHWWARGALPWRWASWGPAAEGTQELWELEGSGPAWRARRVCGGPPAA